MTDTIENLTRDRFLVLFGGVFEHSPWIAEAAWNSGPFYSIESIYAALCAIVRDASNDDILTLLRAHPELAGKEAKSGTMTDWSVAEQTTTGLDALSREEAFEMDALNADYRRKHGFPMIIAVRNHSKECIFAQFRRRLGNATATELENALQQIFAITGFRIEKIGLDIAEEIDVKNQRYQRLRRWPCKSSQRPDVGQKRRLQR